MVLRPSTERNVEGILDKMRFFLEMRFDHVARLNPKLRRVEGDLVWHMLEALRDVICKDKPYAASRYFVADILCGFDWEKKRGLFSPNSQNCLLSEIVKVVKEVESTSRGVVRIRDLRALYEEIDPHLNQLIELMEIWIWWDLADAAEYFAFDCQLERIKALQNTEVNEKFEKFYRKEMSLKDEEPAPTKKRMLDFEYYRTEDLVHRVDYRMENEEIHQVIIGHELEEDAGVDEQILNLAQHVRAVQMLENKPEMEPKQIEYYAKVLHLQPGEVTRERAIQFEERYIRQTKQDLCEALMVGDAGGERFNFKQRSIDHIHKRLEELREQIDPAPRKTEEVEKPAVEPEKESVGA